MLKNLKMSGKMILGFGARVYAYKAQLYVDYKIADQAASVLNDIIPELTELKKITRAQRNLDEIKDIDEERTSYSIAMSTIGSL